MTFPSAIADLNAPDNRMRIGIVSSIAPLMVNVQGTDFPVGRAASFFPNLGETVAIMRQDGTWMIMDRTQGPADATVKFQAGAISTNLAAATSALVPVVFAAPYAAIPSVATNISSGSGLLSGWGSRAINVTTTGFTVFAFGAAATTTLPVQWQAQEMTQ